MYLTRLVLGAAWVPLLTGCMAMGGLGHTGGPGGMASAGYAENGQARAPVQHVEASNGGLSIALSFPRPSGGAGVAIDARLRADSADDDLTDANIWLQVRSPSGGVTRLPMQLLHSSQPGTYRAQYSFSAPGLYLVAAEGRTGTGADVRTVSVTTAVEVGTEAHDGRHHWFTPAALLGGLGMVAMMALMMSGSDF